MVFGFQKRATASNAALRVPIVRVAEPRCADDIDKSHLERFVATRITIEGSRRKRGKKPVLFDDPRSILLKMVESDLPTLLALRGTSKTMESFVNLKVKRHLQEKCETLDIVYPLQIRQGPSILTFGESLNWIGEYVKKLNVTVIPRLTDPNCFHTVRDIELEKSYWHMIAEKEFFGKDVAANDYGTSFETVLRSLPYVEHIEIILTPLPTTRFDDKGLQIDASLYSSETWHWCPLFDEWPAPQNEVGQAAVTHFPALMEIRFGFEEWRPVKLKKVTLTNLTFAGLLALSHDALWNMRVTKDAVATDPLARLQPFWTSIKTININMVSFWQLKDMPTDHRVRIGSKEYKLGITIVSRWLNTMNHWKIKWTKPTLDAEKSEMDGTNLISFDSVKGPGGLYFLLR